jgi:uncharacterized protein
LGFGDFSLLQGGFFKMGTEYHALGTGDFFQDWSDTDLITSNDDWSRVLSIMGYRTGDVTSLTGVDPRTVTTDAGFVPHVVANQTATNTTGGVIEVDRSTSNPTIALQGSNASDYAAIVLHLDTTGRKNVTFSANVRDLDASADDAVQQVAVQYRVGTSGAWTNIFYIADATLAGSATLVTAINVTLPAAAENQPQVQIRILTTNAPGNDELIGIDDIRVTSQPGDVALPGTLNIADASVAEGDAGSSALTFTVNRDGGSAGAVSATWTIAFTGSADAADLAAGQPLTGTVSFAPGETSATITVLVAGDTVHEPNETFQITLSAPTGGASIGDGVATGTILNDDLAPVNRFVFINELHYDNAGADEGEAIEIAAPAGTDLTGWTLVLYNGGTNGVNAQAATVYNTRTLSGTVQDQANGYGTISFAYPRDGIQNGPNDGIALVDPFGRVVQFISYEGPITAANGPAAGMTAQDIGVVQAGSDPIGASLQLVGAGAVYEDFSWVSRPSNSFGGVNGGQTFIGPDATGQVRIADASVVEGDSGVRDMVFTVTRAGGLGQAASVDWVLSLTGSAGLDDLAPGQALTGRVDFAPGVSRVEIRIGVQGDTMGEANETFGVQLVNPAGNIAIVQGSATGTILNDDPMALRIYEIQGEAHRSPYEGQPVLTDGIVTAVANNGFYLQDAVGDGNVRTSDAIFVFTGAAPGVRIGDKVEVRGTVTEFLPGGDAKNLTVTQLNAANISLISTGNALPEAVRIGAGGRLPPSRTIEDDGFTDYDPENDGLDFYESLEGMRVTIEAPLVVSPTNSFGETWVVASGGLGATGVNARGGITISNGDFNPEKIQIDQTPALFAAYNPAHSQGDRLGDVTGVISYSFNTYEVLVTEQVAVIEDVTLGKETTSLKGDRNHLTIASYNVENLDPTDAPAKFELLASNIVYNLAAPDIIGLQEIQDADGPGNGSNLSGIVTAQKLIDAIAAIGGPNYVYIEIAPSTPNSTGGEPNGNIRNGFLFNADRVGYVEGSAALITDPAFNGTRKPLVASFTFNGETVTLVNVHFTSRIGSDPLNGSVQPPANAGEAARNAQGAAVAAFVQEALAANPNLKLGVLGDFNAFYFEQSVSQIEGLVMTNLHRTLPEEERYTYIFDGNAQAIDHMLVSGGLMPGVSFDVVHINAEQSASNRATDHDPVVGRFFIKAPNVAPSALALDGSAVDENRPAGTLVGTLSAIDLDGDTLTYSLDDDAGGRFAVDPATGRLVTTGPLDHEAQASWTVTARATDPDGLSVVKTFTIAVGDVNEAPLDLVIDGASVDENAAAGTLVGRVSARDPDGDTLAYSLVEGGDFFTLDAATGELRTRAAFDYEARASYAIAVEATDPEGLKVARTLTIAVNDINEAPVARADAIAIDEDATSGNLWNLLLANDSDPDAGDILSIQSVNGAGTLGSLVFDPVAKTLRYVADHDSFDALAPGATATDSFTYTIVDKGGLTSTATVTVTVTGIDDGISLNGGNGRDVLNGTSGEDVLIGGNGDDVLYGHGGHDWLLGGNGDDQLFGGAGNDVLVGGRGNDVLTGGSGRDRFVFGKSGGNDVVTDYEKGVDSLVLEDGIAVKSHRVGDVNGDGKLDLTIAFSNGGGQVVLLGVSSFADVTIERGEVLGSVSYGHPENLAANYHVL